MANRIANPHGGTIGRRGATVMWHSILIGAAGAITSQDSALVSGIVAVKTAAKTGRYTLTLPQAYKTWLGGDIGILASDDANYGANTTGLQGFFRDNDIDGGAKDGTIEIQFVQGTYADAEVPSGFTVKIRIDVEVGV